MGKKSLSKAAKKPTIISYNLSPKKVSISCPCTLKGCPFFLLKLTQPLWNKCLDNFLEGERECFVTSSQSVTCRALPRQVAHSSALRLVMGHLVWAHAGTVRGSETHGTVPNHEHYPCQGTGQCEKGQLGPGDGEECGRWGGLQRSWTRKTMEGKCSRGGQGTGCPHTIWPEDTQKTSLAKGEGGKQVMKPDRAPARSLGCQASSTRAPSWAQRALEAPEQEKEWKKVKVQGA